MNFLGFDMSGRFVNMLGLDKNWLWLMKIEQVCEEESAAKIKMRNGD